MVLEIKLIKFGSKVMGGQKQKSEVDEYKELRKLQERGKQLSEKQQKRLDQLTEELTWRGVIDRHGRTRDEGGNIFELSTNPKSHSEYVMRKDISVFGKDFRKK